MPRSRHRKGHNKKKANDRRELEARRHGSITRQLEMNQKIEESFKGQREAVKAKREEVRKATTETLANSEEHRANTSGMMGIGTSEDHSIQKKGTSKSVSKLDDVIPSQFKSEYDSSKSKETHGSRSVKDIKHEDWPGKHKNVGTWFELEDNYAVGINIYQGKVSFPSTRLKS